MSRGPGTDLTVQYCTMKVGEEYRGGYGGIPGNTGEYRGMGGYWGESWGRLKKGGGLKMGETA